MALKIEDRVQEQTTSTGTGNMVVAGAVTSHRTFSSVCAIGDTFYGMVVAVNANGAPTGQWESGLYTYSAANTITRTSVLSGSAGGTTPVNFSSGQKRVFIDLTAAQIKTFTSSANPSFATPAGQDPTLFTSMIFQDEFNATALNSAVWSPVIPGVANDVNQNFSVGNGSLSIWPNSPFIDRHISTAGKFYFNPGCFIEIEAKMPTGRGTAANMWLFINDTATIQSVDIAKTHGSGAPILTGSAYPGYATNTWQPINFASRATANQSAGSTSMKASDHITVPVLSDVLHKYAVKWEATGITFYFDGVQVGAKMSLSMTQRMYLTITMGFDTGTDAPNTNNTPQGQGNSFVVNYVRGWQLA